MPAPAVQMQTLLDELDWDEGLTMPVADATNKALEDELLRVRAAVASVKDELKETDDRVAAMSSHLKNVGQELQHTQVAKLRLLIFLIFTLYIL